MITGFNTDIEYEGVVYHVQTEDKGLDTPIILSLVYVGGAILASKRSPYDDLVVAGFDAGALSERLNRQHKLICAAITAGRIEDLKRLSRNGDGAAAGRKGARKATRAQPPEVASDESAAATKPAGEVPTASATTEAKPAAEVPTIAQESDASAAAETSAPAGAKPAAEAWAQTAAQVSPNGSAATDGFNAATDVTASNVDASPDIIFEESDVDAPGQSRSEESASELPSWFETTAESFESLLKKMADSEAAEAEAAKAEAAKAEAAKAEAVKAEAAEAERQRRFPPKDALVASGVARPVDEFAGQVAQPPAHAETVAGDPAAAREQDTTEIIQVEVEGELHVSLMEERDYKAGEIVTLRVRVARGPLEAREAVNDATVTVKILGTEFRPLILTSKTDRDGVAVIHAWLPRFTSGRAAILVRAAHDGFTAELRRAVRHL